MEIIIIALGSFCFAYYIVNVLYLASIIRRYLKLDPYKRIRPIDCTQCLAVWIALILYFLPIQCAEFLLTIFLSGIIAVKLK